MLSTVKKTLDRIVRENNEINTDGHYTKLGSRVYDAFYGNMNNGEWLEEKEKLLDEVMGEDINKVLCLGCGAGRSIRYLDLKYDLDSLYAIDYSREMVNLANERNSSKINIMEGDFTKLEKLEESEFDLVYMLGCPLNHYRDSIIDNLIKSVSDLADGYFIYDFSQTDKWKEKDLHLSKACCGEFDITRASCGYNNWRDEYYEEDLYMSYLIEKSGLSNKLNINGIKLYSHSIKKHKEKIEKESKSINYMRKFDDKRVLVNLSI